MRAGEVPDPSLGYPASVPPLNIRQSSRLAAQQQFPAKEDIFKSLTGGHQHQHQHPSEFIEK